MIRKAIIVQATYGEKRKNKGAGPSKSLGRWDYEQENDETDQPDHRHNQTTNTQTAEGQAVGSTDLVYHFAKLHSLLNFSTCIIALSGCILTNPSAFGKYKIKLQLVTWQTIVTFSFPFFNQKLGQQMIHSHGDASSWINLQTKSLKTI